MLHVEYMNGVDYGLGDISVPVVRPSMSLPHEKNIFPSAAIFAQCGSLPG